MKSMSKITALLVMVAFVAVSCGKYEDGPKISLLPKSARLINTWKIDESFKDGVSQTVTADEKASCYDIKKDGELSYTFVTGSLSSTYSGTWELSDDKESLKLSYTVVIFGLSTTYTTDYTILRLKSDELWLEKVSGNNTFEYHYITK